MKLINSVSKDKLRGGFYTPKKIANFMLKWGLKNTNNYDILEPSCGDGVFLNELSKLDFTYNSLKAIEYDKIEFDKAKSINLKKSYIENNDFYEYFHSTSDKFDLVIGNPPYIRYQYFKENQKQLAERMFSEIGLKYSKLTNAWVSFVIGSSLLLKDTGKIAFVLPAEILQVSYALQLRNFLGHFYNKITIISFQKLVFEKIQQEVVILLCQKDDSNEHKIDHLELYDENSLDELDLDEVNYPKKEIDFKSNKWTFYFLEQEEINFLENIINNDLLPKFSDFAKAEVGITTGANAFFTVPYSTVKRYNLYDFAKPMVGRSVQVPSVTFNSKDWDINKENEARSFLLVFPNRKYLEENGYQGALEYISLGEKEEIHKGYKCGIRDEWQIIPSLSISDALFIRRNNLYPKLIRNDINAYTTDTMHRVSIKKGVIKDSFISSYYNSLSFAFAEISGRSHGGGVLELMPNEVENIYIPYCEKNNVLLSKINDMLRDKTDITEILEMTDKFILKDKFNFSDDDIQIARNIWKKLSKRRLKRGKKS
ncbi:class I SAM-dependent methyltransferase [Aliarcobacter skirrowii]|uniref:class I SAM-dependent methyltransferase n=1 Tax=Aliarcobacter skirrowii TaxID=28200 RepID=UPI0029ABCC3A|nr:class I SAM-dependent methyltransferase [Aliarcobacter skirrowii]MDX4058797.1 class I SAM-dependent methyltransferase [Aliarcobacter skirrowii]